jgi:hypothetical protein
MKKTVQIVTIPLNKKGWSKGDLLTRTPGQIYQYMLAKEESTPINDTIWQAKQLLVLSDDEIREGDNVLVNKNTIQTAEKYGSVIGYTTADGVAFKYFNPREDRPKKDFKIISSYPHIPGTLKVSIKTIIEWINNNAPEEANVEIVKDCNGWGGRGCKSLCSCPLKYKVEEFAYSGDSYPTDNLILEFDKKQSENIEVLQSTILEIKPSIPTNEEIRMKAKSEYDKLISNYAVLDWHTFKRAYHVAYKQALKDLNHE